ncbi:hypothetical protein SNOG_07720 [Parastagonospora nodorum SN15]|uniref:Uncharacterized protein n=1 Tax=Phaeosphaeria nodorum (strain SN15 / ATCC MYA-4574 / FGSC 10173) TaxID=321614 RepID=Q0UKJ4_PHANO|nr:hypothetical protein SNOG_07720 [Parastagonospora nodorum SN15]EAT85186.1 hypothetical protein SNOG_07720 [Parastagonospora nodorum SN15]
MGSGIILKTRLPFRPNPEPPANNNVTVRNHCCRPKVQRDELIVHPTMSIAEIPDDSLTDNLMGQGST